MKGKKGSVGSILVDFYAYGAWVFVIIIFAILFQFVKGGITETISSEGSDMNVRTTLINFVRSPVEIDINNDNIKENMTVGELVVFTNLEDDDSEAYKLLMEKTKKILSMLWDNQRGFFCGVEFNILKDEEEKTFSYKKKGFSNEIEEMRDYRMCDEGSLIESELFIPVPIGYEEKVKVNLKVIEFRGTPGIQTK
ncbi:hypothetical protein HQ529_05555 [Candidatus Woesearchaeota archaeon]|nr:hypothetical protein [Candidatus Woesearchaeota archaeon]